MMISDYFEKPFPPRRVLVIQLGDIGDVVWTLPAFRAIRKTWPGAELSVLLRDKIGSLLSAVDPAVKTFEVPGKGGGVFASIISTYLLIRALRREHFDMVFDMRADERGGYMAFVTGAPFRVALHYPSMKGLRNHLFTHLVGLTGKPLHVRAAGQALYILQAFGIETDDVVPRLRVSRDVSNRASQMIASKGLSVSMQENEILGKDWVTLNPFSRWSYKEWGMEKWERIIDWLYEEFAIKSVIVGSPGEKERAEALVAACPGRAFNIAGSTTLAELAGVLALSRLHIGVDSAAPHIAAAVGTPTVTIYGPSDWRYWAPPGKNNRVVVSEMPCVPCHLKGCNGSGRSLCLEKLEVEQVQAVIKEALLSGRESLNGIAVW
ncbi:MAG: glycosyltransferase family 9 protein [Syntrophales bacterium]